jgi:SAM-dependent methyltransferase
MIKHVMRALKRFAWFKRLNAKTTYEFLAKNIPAEEWHFMNYGYMPTSTEPILTLPANQQQQYPLQMYHYLATKTLIEGKKVLEVGSGRGGGANYIAQYLSPASYIGMDLAHNAVQLANKLHSCTNLKFIQGSAERIPLKDGAVDVVLNVESCHAYGSVEKFLREVKRVLKPGGYLLLVDFRSENTMHVLQSQLKDSGMELIEDENISSNVIRSIEAENVTKIDRIHRLIPLKWQKLFCEFAGVVGSPFHLTLKDGSRQYHRFVLRKSL